MHTLPRRLRPSAACVSRAAAVFLLAAASLAVPAFASAQTAADLYARAQKRASAATAAPTAASLRAAAGAYESLVRRYPRSGFCDDALWHGAMTARLAWERFHQPADLATATRLLKWLRREYPSSSWVGQAATQLAALSQPARPAPTKAAPGASAAAAPAPARPPAPPSAIATVRSISRV